MNIYDIIQKEFGTRNIRVNPRKTLAFTTTSAEVLTQNQQRIGLLLVNLNANDAYVNFGQAASSSYGILLQRGGGSLLLTAKEDMTLVAEAIHGIIATSNGSILCIEIEVF